mmetsp:Transcript_91429/g.209519  ORF Transcript_91429/g.209519 Transcript_91429/m.209519 type:complete len:154 (+) Transcript_91429:41-502(+)
MLHGRPELGPVAAGFGARRATTRSQFGLCDAGIVNWCLRVVNSVGWTSPLPTREETGGMVLGRLFARVFPNLCELVAQGGGMLHMSCDCCFLEEGAQVATLQIAPSSPVLVSGGGQLPRLFHRCSPLTATMSGCVFVCAGVVGGTLPVLALSV